MEGRADLAFGLASSVGPVPFDSATEAVDFALRLHGRFPTVPVPTSPDASLLAQAIHGLTGIGLSDDGVHLGDRLPSASDAAATALVVDGTPFAPLHTMAGRLRTLDDAGAVATPVRLPVLGPVSLAVSLSEAGLAIGEAAELATAIVAARSVAMLGALRSTSGAAGRLVAVVLSEPALVGSMHPTFPLLPSQVRSMLDPVVDALDRAGSAESLLIGVHVPGPCDWSTVVGAGPSLVCVPVERSVVGWAGLFGDLLDRGGRICWGAVPVDRPIGASEDVHWRRLIGVWTGLVADGVDPMLLRLRSSFAPADGLQRFAPAQAELLMGLAVAVAERVRHQAVAARLSLGA